MILPIVAAGAPGLRTACPPVPPELVGTRELHELVEQMRLTMLDAPGVGLAANQVDRALRVLVLQDPATAPEIPAEMARHPVPFMALLNPTLEVAADSRPALWFEGCLSVRGWTAVVARHDHVVVTAQSVDGEPVTVDARGWHARILQHEIDHLDGVLYLDRMLTRTFMSRDAYVATWAGRPVREVLEHLGAT